MNSPISPVLVLGAGATKACNGPLTNDILLEADRAVSNIEREGYLALVDRFLEDVFHLPPRPSRDRFSYPSLLSGRGFSKALEELFMSEGGEANDLEHRYSCHGSPCKNCGTFVRPVMITPTQKKDYRNPHIAQVWYKAEGLLRSASSAVFVGYSMPADDVEVVYLLKRGLEHLPAQEITVVEFDKENRTVLQHEVGQRYQSIFGREIQWHTCGFAGWLDERAKGLTTCTGVPAGSLI